MPTGLHRPAFGLDKPDPGYSPPAGHVFGALDALGSRDSAADLADPHDQLRGKGNVWRAV